MGKRFVARSRQAWEVLLPPATADEDQVVSSARSWLAARLEGYVQSDLEAPITLAVPDRFLKILGDAPEKPTIDASGRQNETPQHEHPTR